MKKTVINDSLQVHNTFIKIISFSWLRKSAIVEIVALLFVILFLYAGISKLMEYAVFKEQLAQSPILKPFAGFMAWVLPAAEFIASALLFFPHTRLKGLYAALPLMILFTGYIGAILTFSKELPCSCGGVLEQLSWQGHIVFNGAFVFLGLIGIRLGRRLSANIS